MLTDIGQLERCDCQVSLDYNYLHVAVNFIVNGKKAVSVST